MNRTRPTLLVWALLLVAGGVVVADEPRAVAADSEPTAKTRHARVAARRNGIAVICHRGAHEFAHENTLEAYRATFELGGDGNEIDVRATKDGVLVCFHDDMLDQLLCAYGDVSDYTWDELQHFRFRAPGHFGDDCRIPTLADVYELHCRYGGLLHLDVKQPGLERAIADQLSRFDMWDHVAHVNANNAQELLRDSRLQLRSYKGELYSDHGELFPDSIATMLKKSGDGVICDDPRGVVRALGRRWMKMSGESVAPRLASSAALPLATPPNVKECLATIQAADDWNHVGETAEERTALAQRIVARAQAADGLLAARDSSAAVWAALETRVRNRSLHQDWGYHGLDGASALRALIQLHAPNAVETARFVQWRDDPALEPVVNRQWNNPRAWTDFRVKMVIWPALEQLPGTATEQLCRDYLALGDTEARRLGPPQFDEAAKTLLTISPNTDTAMELMSHRRQVVRGRAILFCLAHAEASWSQAAMKKCAPHALAYVVAN